VHGDRIIRYRLSRQRDARAKINIPIMR
jgi:hypothetical protein